MFNIMLSLEYMKGHQKRASPSGNLCGTAAKAEAAHSITRESVNMNVSDILTNHLNKTSKCGCVTKKWGC